MVKKFPLSNFKLWLFISALFAFSNAFSANFYVNDNSIAGDVYCSAIGSTSGTGTASNPFLTIKAARDHVATLAPGMHIIYVDTGTYVQSSSLIVSMNIANLTVTGAGYNKTICKGTGTSVFGTIDANNVTLNNLTLMDFAASSSSTGLALTVNAGKTGVLIENIRILNSGPTGSSSLGALLIQAQANVTINNSGFNCNLKTGIQVNGQGGGTNTAITTVNINNCHFSGNVTSAILNNGPFVHINVDNCVFEKNRAQNGGAIYFDSMAGKLTVTDSRFEGNYSTKAGSSTNGINGGGAIYIATSNNSGSDLILDRPISLIQNCSFTGNYASANYSNGGAIHYASGVNNTVKNCSFQNNYTTVDASGTTISSGEDIYMNNSSAANLAVTIDGCSFNSIYTNDASAVNVYNGTGTFVTTASGLPTANGAGVAISKPEFFNSIAATTCSGCTTTNPTVTPTPTTEVVVCNPCSLITNAILSQPVCNNDTRCITLNNLPSGIWTITNDSPAVSVMGTGITTTICDLAPGTYSFTATVAGCPTEPSAPITIVAYTTPLLTGTKTIYVNDASTTGDTFTSSVGNNANSGLTAALPKLTLTAALALAGPGDTILIDSGTYTDKNLTISIPSLTIKGAGDTKTIFNNNGASTNTNLLMTITSENVTIEAIGVTKYNNGVSSGASAISINGACNFLIRNVRVFQNLNAGGTDASIVITGSATGTFIGGGVNCNPNGASLGGGGVMISGAGNIVLFESYSFSKNPEDLVPGAGLSISGGGTSIVTIKNSVFDSNTYGGGTGGGAIYVYAASVNINGCKFLNNKCNNTGGGRSYGGAILVDSSSNVTIDNSVFTSNQAVTSGSGGAIAVNTSSSGTSSTVIITKTTFDSNTGAQGNHLYTKSGTGRPAAIIASNCTFVTNASNSVRKSF